MTTDEIVARLVEKHREECPCCGYTGLWPPLYETQAEAVRKLVEEVLTLAQKPGD
jgi:hypothetical protein